MNIACPFCGALVAIPVDTRFIRRTEAWPKGQQLHVGFHDAYVLHTCVPPEHQDK